MFPIILKTLKPILPLHALYTGNSLVHFAAFFGLYLVLVSDTFKLGLSRFVRFNAAQALLLNVLLMLPRLFEMVLSPPTAGPMLKAYVMAQNAIWITVAVAVGASVLGCFVGTSIRLPYIASAADQQASG